MRCRISGRGRFAQFLLIQPLQSLFAIKLNKISMEIIFRKPFLQKKIFNVFNSCLHVFYKFLIEESLVNILMKKPPNDFLMRRTEISDVIWSDLKCRKSFLIEKKYELTLDVSRHLSKGVFETKKKQFHDSWTFPLKQW